MSSVKTERQPVTRRHLLKRLDVTGPAPNVNAEDGARLRRDQLLDLGGIDVVAQGVDVAEDRGHALPLQSMGSRDEREGGHDDLAGQPARLRHDLQGRRTIADGDAVPHPKKPGYTRLQLTDVGSVVREPVAVQHHLDPSRQPRAISDVGPANVQWLLERRAPAKESQARRAA